MKNAGLFEKHVEKLVLLVALGLSFYALWSFYLSDPFRVEDPQTGSMIEPQEWEDRIIDAAAEVEAAIERPDSFLADVERVSYASRFQTRLRIKLLDMGVLPAPLGAEGLDDQFGEIVAPPQQEGDFPWVTPPEPEDLRSRVDFAVLAPPVGVGSQVEELRRRWEQLIGPERPRDFRYVSISADFDLAEWRRRLAQGGVTPRPGFRKIPERWQQEALFVADVKLQRSRWDRRTSSWTEPVTVPPLPNTALNFREEIAEPPTWTGSEPTEVRRRIVRRQEELARPPFPPLAAGRWLPPSDPLTPEQTRRALALTEQIAELESRLESLETGQPAPSPARGGGEAGAARVGSGAGAEELRAQIRRLVEQRNDLLGVDESVFGVDDELRIRDAEAADGFTPVPMADRDEASELTVWAHDVTVQAGELYRYRISVAMLSPFFNRRGELNQRQLAAYGNQLAVESAFSEWTDPIRIWPDETEFFLVDADRSDAGRRSADFEVYKVFNGRIRMVQLSAREGDRLVARLDVGGEEVELDTEATLVSLEFDQPTSRLGRSTVRMVYYDPSEGRLGERMLDADRRSLKRERLQLRRSTAEGLVSGRPNAGGTSLAGR